uniref:Uncharacterized protein n=1 Tax=Anguilla anguilla TaxID=7936 RepID=A0A0E9WQR6_ANGAN
MKNMQYELSQEIYFRHKKLHTQYILYICKKKKQKKKIRIT